MSIECCRALIKHEPLAVAGIWRPTDMRTSPLEWKDRRPTHTRLWQPRSDRLLAMCRHSDEVDATSDPLTVLIRMAQQSTVERAFELARSGCVRDVDALIRTLKLEGFEGVSVHLASPGIRRQLRELIKAGVPGKPRPPS
jgi:hypothetical protein